MSAFNMYHYQRDKCIYEDCKKLNLKRSLFNRLYSSKSIDTLDSELLVKCLSCSGVFEILGCSLHTAKVLRLCLIFFSFYFLKIDCTNKARCSRT